MCGFQLEQEWVDAYAPGSAEHLIKHRHQVSDLLLYGVSRSATTTKKHAE